VTDDTQWHENVENLGWRRSLALVVGSINGLLVVSYVVFFAFFNFVTEVSPKDRGKINLWAAALIVSGILSMVALWHASNEANKPLRLIAFLSTLVLFAFGIAIWYSAFGDTRSLLPPWQALFCLGLAFVNSFALFTHR
jgi:hypothetical protein